MAYVIVLGVVLIVLVVLLAVAVTLGNQSLLEMDVFNASVPVTLTGVFFTGAGSVVVLLLGIVLIHRGVAFERRRRRQFKPLPAAPATHSAPVQPVSVTPPTPPASTPAREPVIAPGPVPTLAPVPAPAPAPASASVEDRSALLAEAEELTRDEPLR